MKLANRSNLLESQLILEASKGDLDAFNHLVLKYQELVFNKAYALLTDMLGELPDIYRNLITLIDLHELDYSEAAQVLEIPIGTVKSRLARGRFQMKEKLQNSFDFPRSFSLADARLVA